jgi:general secretion pathway protein A
MNENWRTFFGFKKEPFSTDLDIGDILVTEGLSGVKTRFDYVSRLGAVGLVTGEIGSGKSTAVRYSCGKLHPSEYRPIYVIASSGTVLELYKQISAELGIYTPCNSRALMAGRIRKEIENSVCGKKMKNILIIDEASLLRPDVLAELHTLCQFEKDARAWLPIILVGQSDLVDKLGFRASAPLASRIIARSHLEGLDSKGMRQYLEHWLKLAGATTNLFENSALTAIHQGAGGLLRKANHLARGALIAASKNQSMTVSAEHVRLAASEIL